MAVIAVNPEEKEAVRAELNHYAADVAAELSGVDPNVTVDMVTADTPEFMIEDKVARALISALYAAPHGVIAMSHDIEGLVETSTNLASVKMTEPGKIVVATSQRSSVESEKYDIAIKLSVCSVWPELNLLMATGIRAGNPICTLALKILQSRLIKNYTNRPLLSRLFMPDWSVDCF